MDQGGAASRKWKGRVVASGNALYCCRSCTPRRAALLRLPVPARRAHMGKSDIEIAHEAKLQPIQAIGETLGLKESDLEVYGRHKAKLTTETIERLRGRPDGALVLVTAMTPTPAGEGKSTTTVGLGDAFRRIGKRVDRGHSRAVAGAVLRRQGRGGRGRLRPGHADGGDQPPLHRRLSRGDLRPQPAGRRARQPHLPGQRAGLRRAAPDLEARGRHERPRPAQHRAGPRAGRCTACPASPASRSPWPPRSWPCSAWPRISPTSRPAWPG